MVAAAAEAVVEVEAKAGEAATAVTGAEMVESFFTSLAGGAPKRYNRHSSTTAVATKKTRARLAMRKN